MDGRFSIGLDYGTNSVRAIIVDLARRIGIEEIRLAGVPRISARR